MDSKTATELIVWWLALTSGWTFTLFGVDKRRAKRGGAHRISESFLLGISALGGWPGGLLGIVCFRHKTAKFSFLLKFLAALVVFAFLVAGALHALGKI